MQRLRDASTRQLETIFEQAEGDQQLLQALLAELCQRPSASAQALLAEVQVETFRLAQGVSDDTIDWDKVISTHQLHEAQRAACRKRQPKAQQLAIAVLETWMIIETLTPQTFHTPQELANRGTLLPLDHQAPWVHDQPNESGKSRYYQVYLGDLDIRDTHETLIELYGDRPEMLGQLGSAVMAVATFNEHGILVGDYGVGVSCFAWSYGRARQNKLNHLPFWQGAERLLIRRLRKKLSPLCAEQLPRPVTYDDLCQAAHWLVENLALPVEEVQPVRFSVRITQASEKRPPSSPLMNSFLLNDLWRAQDALKKNQASQVLQQYLSQESQCKTHQGDFNHAITQALDITKLPLSRWPSRDGHELDGLQQAAVNIALSHEGPALFSVHGPPGTGKTTLLRDIIAGVVAQRAQVLCEFDDPEEAFGQAQIVKYGDQRYDIYPMDARLLGHEILVCSRNNKAVENISLELPMKREVNRSCASVHYFSQTMQAYLDYKHAKATQQESANQTLPLFPQLLAPEIEPVDEPWGLMAAALGHGANRRAYLQSVWLDDVHGLKRYFEKMSLAWEQAEAMGEAAQQEKNLDEYFFLPASKEEALHNWRDARTAFLAQQEKVRGLLPNTAPVHDAYYQCPATPILQSERSELFVAAMRLHQAFIIAAAPKFKNNLSGYFRVIAGARGSKPELLQHLWAAGSFITPVVSTTFASVSRMLHDMPSQSIGWVLVDEAGQASPQDAVGALLRAQRAIIVGDPQQIEPVVSIPDGLIRGIADYHGLDALQWTAPDMSVQTLADRVNPFGLRLHEREIGWPILVHRRCAEPMFSMINQMAYKGLMVRPEHKQGHAQWIQVDGQSLHKWCADEGQKCLELVSQLLKKSSEPIYIISPFRHCAQSLKALFRQEKKVLQSVGVVDPSHWIRQSIGTVHTFQGRQAARVILVLGAQGADEKGARHWATNTVNLCNVAVSRAQRALYIIGNYHLWGQLGAMQFIAEYTR